MSPGAEPRYEIKMVCEERAWPQVRAELMLLPAALRNLYPPRWVQSIYLDTHEDDALEENLAGVSQRRKIRFRWYGEAARGVQGRLECKRRENMLGTKDVLELPEPVDVDGQTRTAFIAALRAQSTPQWRERLHGALQPAQWIRYHREYYQSTDGTVRVTADRHLQTFDQRRRWRISRAAPTPLPRLLVVEFKSDQSSRDSLEQLLHDTPLVVDKCSKFVLASSPFEGPLVARFDRG